MTAAAQVKDSDVRRVTVVLVRLVQALEHDKADRVAAASLPAQAEAVTAAAYALAVMLRRDDEIVPPQQVPKG